MAHLGIALLVYTGFVLDLSLRQEMMIRGVSPELLLLAMSAAVVGLRDHSAVVWAAVIGFLIDAVSTGPLGISMFCSVAIVFAVRKLLPRQTGYFWPAAVGIAALLTFTVQLSSATARSLILGRAIDRNSMLTAAALAAAYTGFLFAGLRIAYGICMRQLLRMIRAESLSRSATSGRYA